MKPFGQWFAEQAPVIAELPDDVDEMKDGTFRARCCRCDESFELDLSREEIIKHYAKPVYSGWYCGRSERCCP